MGSGSWGSGNFQRSRNVPFVVRVVGLKASCNVEVTRLMGQGGLFQHCIEIVRILWVYVNNLFSAFVDILLEFFSFLSFLFLNFFLSFCLPFFLLPNATICPSWNSWSPPSPPLHPPTFCLSLSLCKLLYKSVTFASLPKTKLLKS